jgi:glycosyltransferase involved in cell wall biosynthesis
MSSKERYKGYDKVIQSLPNVIASYPEVKYMLSGTFDVGEKKHLDNIVQQLGISDFVFFTGFIKDDELVTHFNISDLYIMPSMKEGFGIVFIEAMYYGLPVIAGNRDGSVDALLKGELGLLIDPIHINEIATAIKLIFENKQQYIPDKGKMMDHFSFEAYKRNLESVLA